VTKQIKRKIIKEKKKIKLSYSDALALYEYLTKTGLITKEEIKNKKLNDDSPFQQYEIEIEPNQSKDVARKVWISLAKQNNLYCEVCGQPIYYKSLYGNHNNALTVEHRHPKSKGGANVTPNLGPAHKLCNEIKTNITPEVWERVGLLKLLQYGIIVDLEKTRYNYLRRIKEDQIINELVENQR
jgi:hypothetical protein